ncbi:MAG: MerR family transcriptional regulator [Lachnospiraceae bacterium]|nr:MerR family transcriptional regulator [Lachnospiraceae bacterium]
MNIKEIEARSGLARANIRYYEKEGLLHPERRENGYRDYSEEDLELLKKIRLMRELGISLEEIRRLIEQPQILEEIMGQRMQGMETEVLDLNDAITVCSEIRHDGAVFNSMETDRYLNRLEELAQERNRPDDLSQQVLESDREPSSVWPWRRFLARMLDLQLCSWLWLFVWIVPLKQVNGSGFFYSLLNTAAAMIFMVVLEPFFLAYTGTTPGKWIFGLSVSDEDGKRLSYSDGVKRTVRVLIFGMGLQIPVVELFCMYRGYKKYVNGQGLSWEREDVRQSEISFCEKKLYRTVIVYILVLGIGFGGSFLVSTYQLIPPNRGELTVEEFAENYNYYVNMMSRLTGESCRNTDFLNEDGQYRENSEANDSEGMTVYLDLAAYEAPVWEYKTENGIISEASFQVQFSTSYPVSSYSDPMVCSILALGGAWDEASVLNMAVYRLTKRTADIGFGDYEFSDCGIHVSCRMEYDGEKISKEQRNQQWLDGYSQKIHDFSLEFVMNPIK